MASAAAAGSSAMMPTATAPATSRWTSRRCAGPSGTTGSTTSPAPTARSTSRRTPRGSPATSGRWSSTPACPRPTPRMPSAGDATSRGRSCGASSSRASGLLRAPPSTRIPPSLFAALAARLEADPVSGRARDAFGNLRRVTVDQTGLASASVPPGPAQPGRDRRRDGRAARPWRRGAVAAAGRRVALLAGGRGRPAASSRWGPTGPPCATTSTSGSTASAPRAGPPGAVRGLAGRAARRHVRPVHRRGVGGVLVARRLHRVAVAGPLRARRPRRSPDRRPGPGARG